MLNNSIKLVNPLVFLDLASTDIDLKKARVNVDYPPTENTSLEIGRLILSKHLLPFEVISILLLGALIGSATIARKKR